MDMDAVACALRVKRKPYAALVVKKVEAVEMWLAALYLRPRLLLVGVRGIQPWAGLREP